MIPLTRGAVDRTKLDSAVILTMKAATEVVAHVISIQATYNHVFTACSGRITSTESNKHVLRAHSLLVQDFIPSKHHNVINIPHARVMMR